VERAPRAPHAYVVLADYRRRAYGKILVLARALLGSRPTSSVDLRRIDMHREAVLTALIPKLSCRGCRPNAPFADLLKLLRFMESKEFAN
jgi:hypothetical protein